LRRVATTRIAVLWLWGVCHAKGGGSDVRILSTATISCHGTLQSAGNASWPLCRRARQY
jgi:hypothetical protein